MWWKITGILLVAYTLVAGMRVPLKPGILEVKPEAVSTGARMTLRISGYNSRYTLPGNWRVWLTYDDRHALAATAIRVVDDRHMEAEFDIPAELPRKEEVAQLNLIVDHPEDGVSLLPEAVEIIRDPATVVVGEEPAWTRTPVKDLHTRKDFSFPYQNILYESIRNTYYHVPMWFALLFLFAASVVYSARYLRQPNPEWDRRAAAYAETGLLFGFLGLVTGMLWATYTWGKPWSNDIKQTMTAVALLIYLAYFILRRSFDEPEKSARLAAVYNVFAFASLIPLLYIVPRMFASLHPGATGNPALGSQDLDNTMRLVFYPAIAGWSLLGFWIAELRFRYQRVHDRALKLD